MLKTEQAHSSAKIYEQVFVSMLHIFPLSLIHHTNARSENPFLPNSHGKSAETEAKHHTQWYNVFLPPPLLQIYIHPNTRKISYFHLLILFLSLFWFNLVAHRFQHSIPHWGKLTLIEEAAHRTKKRESLIESGLTNIIHNSKLYILIHPAAFRWIHTYGRIVTYDIIILRQNKIHKTF